mgnify:CR=1 FL=1
MGLPVLIMGDSGSGKTYSIKNFDASEVSVFSVEKSRLPFQKKLSTISLKKRKQKSQRPQRNPKRLLSTAL